MTIERRRLVVFAAGLLLAVAAHAAAPGASLQLEELTWTELRDRIAGGATTVLVPIGGTEQNGPHMVLGKHNVRVRILASRIAERLGNTIVAPVVAYVPEGRIDPPTQHMRWTGTITIPESAFEAVLESAARSFRLHGFRNVIFVGDHGGYQQNMEHVAVRMNREFDAGPCRVYALGAYYRVSQTDYVQALKAHGIVADEIGEHAGLADTSLALAVEPSLVRAETAATPPRGAHDGVSGDPRRASAELGRLGSERIVDATVNAIQALQREHAAAPAKAIN